MKNIMHTGELFNTDTALNELFDLMINTADDTVYYLKPTDSDDMYRTIWYDAEQDEFVDFMGYPIFRHSWIDDHAEWLIMILK